MTARLPVPDFDRPGESWRVELEPGWVLTTDGLCMARGCYRPAVALRPRNAYSLCATHVRAQSMWIEHGRVVSWALRP